MPVLKLSMLRNIFSPNESDNNVPIVDNSGAIPPIVLWNFVNAKPMSTSVFLNDKKPCD